MKLSGTWRCRIQHCRPRAYIYSAWHLEWPASNSHTEAGARRWCVQVCEQALGDEIKPLHRERKCETMPGWFQGCPPTAPRMLHILPSLPPWVSTPLFSFVLVMLSPAAQPFHLLPETFSAKWLIHHLHPFGLPSLCNVCLPGQRQQFRGTTVHDHFFPSEKHSITFKSIFLCIFFLKKNHIFLYTCKPSETLAQLFFPQLRDFFFKCYIII